MNNLETNNISIKNKMHRFPRKLNINKLNEYSLKIVEKNFPRTGANSSFEFIKNSIDSDDRIPKNEKLKSIVEFYNGIIDISRQEKKLKEKKNRLLLKYLPSHIEAPSKKVRENITPYKVVISYTMDYWEIPEPNNITGANGEIITDINGNPLIIKAKNNDDLVNQIEQQLSLLFTNVWDGYGERGNGSRIYKSIHNEQYIGNKYFIQTDSFDIIHVLTNYTYSANLPMKKK